MTEENPPISLVLSSGGARGLAHIGAIRCLEDRGFEIGSISGSSMGALIGGIHASDKLDEFAEWVRALRRTDIMQLLDFGWLSGGGLFKGERIIGVLKEMVGDRAIEDLPIGFTAVATDLNRKREVWINQGSLFDGIRASIAIPMVFAPVKKDGLILADGGILNPLPIAPILTHRTDLIVAVDVNGQDERSLNVRMDLDAYEDAPFLDEQEEEKEDEADGGVREAVRGFIEDLLKSDDAQEREHGVIDVALEAMDTMQVALSRLKLSVYSPDVLVQVPRNVAHFYEFERAGELIDLGYERMDTVLTTPDNP